MGNRHTSISFLRQVSKNRRTCLLLIAFSALFFFYWDSLLFSSAKEHRHQNPWLRSNLESSKRFQRSDSGTEKIEGRKELFGGEWGTSMKKESEDLSSVLDDDRDEEKGNDWKMSSDKNAFYDAKEHSESKEKKPSTFAETITVNPRENSTNDDSSYPRSVKENKQEHEANGSSETESVDLIENSAQNNTISNSFKESKEVPESKGFIASAVSADDIHIRKGEEKTSLGNTLPRTNGDVVRPRNTDGSENSSEKKAREDKSGHSGHCDIYSGKWVHSNGDPLYNADKCFFLSGDYDCIGNGRTDLGYLQWRWEPHGCNIPRINATRMLEWLKDKSLMFVGDSISMSQWESMLCILSSGVPQERIMLHNLDGATAYLIEDYNATVAFYWAPFLVEQADVVRGNTSRPILRLDAIENKGNAWKNMDVIVFSSDRWWAHRNKPNMTDYFQEGSTLYHELDISFAFQKGMETWANWVEANLDPAKTRVFFRGFSPMHYNSQQWEKNSNQNCFNETEPIVKEEFLNSYYQKMETLDNVLAQMKFPVTVMNITRLSDYRKDAHTSLYGLYHRLKLTQGQRNDPDRWADCSSWCIPGLPDIWNELLYVSLVMNF